MKILYIIILLEIILLTIALELQRDLVLFQAQSVPDKGFFVLMNHTSAANNETITFNNSLRNSALSNNQFYRTSNESGKYGLI